MGVAPAIACEKSSQASGYFRRPKSFDGVRIESETSIVKVLGEPASLPSAEIDRLAHILTQVRPAK
jgi:hypothetical protein